MISRTGYRCYSHRDTEQVKKMHKQLSFGERMSCFIIKYGLKIFLSLLFAALHCSVFSKSNINTLCLYELSYFEEHLTKKIFNNDSNLTSFMDTTGYKDSRIIKGKKTTPDFNKFVYFAFAGWPCTITNIIEKKDSVIVQYKEEFRNTNNSHRIAPSRPVSVAAVYYIPFTKKTIVFFDCTNDTKTGSGSSE